MEASGDGPRDPSPGTGDHEPSSAAAPTLPQRDQGPPAQEPLAQGPPEKGPPSGTSRHGRTPGDHGDGGPAKEEPPIRRAARGNLSTISSTLTSALVVALIANYQHDQTVIIIATLVLLAANCVMYAISFVIPATPAIRAEWRRLRTRLRGWRAARRAAVAGDHGTAAVSTPTRDVPVSPAGKESPAGKLPGRQVRLLILAGVLAAVAVTAVMFFLGYWVIGDRFAHGPLPGTGGLLGIVVVGAALVWWVHGSPEPTPGSPSPPHSRPLPWARAQLRSWASSRRNSALLACAVAIGLSAGGTLGNADLMPGPVPVAQCPPPTELRVLAATEILVPIQAAIIEFEQDERTVLRTNCYAIDVTAYAADTDKAADDGIADGWNLVDGPRPDIWIPASTEELPVEKGDAGQPHLGPPHSIASSPIVIAVPSTLVTKALRPDEHDASLASVYQAISGSFSLQVPNPRLSETARLGIADLYPALSPTERARIAASASFPPDSGSLLCQATPARPSAYLVSEAAVLASDNGRLAAPTCLSQPSAQQRLTAFYPVDGSALDFPFTTVTWHGAPVSKARAAAEREFFNWLTSPAGDGVLTKNGLEAPGAWPANLPSPSSISTAVNGFTQIQPSARILVAIDDSSPMEPYLGQITQAVDSVLGPHAQGGNLSGRDSFGIWAFPGPGTSTDQAPVPLAPDTSAQQARVPGTVATITAHGHSAEFDLLYDAALSLNIHAPNGSASSIVLLTDGDNQQTDPGGSDIGTITTLLSHLAPGNSPIKVYVIAFGPSGCAETPSGLPSDSLNALAKAGDGHCDAAASDSPQQQLAQDISTLSTGG